MGFVLIVRVQSPGAALPEGGPGGGGGPGGNQKCSWEGGEWTPGGGGPPHWCRGAQGPGNPYTPLFGAPRAPWAQGNMGTLDPGTLGGPGDPNERGTLGHQTRGCPHKDPGTLGGPWGPPKSHVLLCWARDPGHRAKGPRGTMEPHFFYTLFFWGELFARMNALLWGGTLREDDCASLGGNSS